MAVRFQQVSKTFPGGVVAVDNISKEFNRGILYGIVGPNGAGKSTLMNLMSGYLVPDNGDIFIHGVRISDYHEALSAGVVKVEQNPNLAPGLTLSEHLALMLSTLPYKAGAPTEKCEKLMDRIGVKTSFEAKVEELPLSHLRVFEIAKALILCDLFYECGIKPILILDEATAFLPTREKKNLKDILRNLLPKEYTIFMISHDLSEVIDVSDEIIVMTNGKIVANFKSQNLDLMELARSMFDVTLVSENSKSFTKTELTENSPALKIENLSVKDDRGNLVINNLDLTVYVGEVFAIAVLPGTGEKELAECLYGIRRAENGKITLYGEDVTNRSTSHIKRFGLSIISDDRVRDGIIPDASVIDNLTIGSEYKFDYFKGIFIDKKKRKTLVEQLIKEFSIRVKSIKAPITTLSGGNMQRVYLARVMGREPKLLIALHPTIGLDPLGTKLFFDKINERRMKNLTTIIISPNIKELMEFCDRISVMSNGKIVGIYKPDEVTLEKLGLIVSGVA